MTSTQDLPKILKTEDDARRVLETFKKTDTSTPLEFLDTLANLLEGYFCRNAGSDVQKEYKVLLEVRS